MDIQQKIHRVISNLDASELMYDKFCRQIKAAVSLTEKYKNDLLRRLDTITFENRLCHGDFHLFNLISADGKMYIIDWVDSSAGDIRPMYAGHIFYIVSILLNWLTAIFRFTVRRADCPKRRFCGAPQ